MNEAQKQEIVKRARKGDTFADIGRDMGVSREWIRRLVRDAGVSPAATRRGRRVPLVCEFCQKPFLAKPYEAKRGRRFCTHEHATLHARTARENASPRPYRHRDGHWWVRDPETGRQMRLERYLMQQKLGRVLDSSEWVRLLDDDPNNLSLDNLVLIQTRSAGDPSDTE